MWRPSRNSTPTNALLRPLAAAAAAFLLAAALPAAAQTAPAFAFDEAGLHAFVTQQVAAAGSPFTRFEVQIGRPTSTTALERCSRTEPFVPAGARFWGRGSVGVRCLEGARWSMLVPVTVRAWGPALVAAVPLAAGALPGPDDVREQEVEWTRESGPLLRDVSQLKGQSLQRPVAPGQALRADHLRSAQVVQAGDPVRLRIVGAGFAISATGQALGSAAEGQPLRVRTDFGKVLSGTAREGRIVEVAL